MKYRVRRWSLAVIIGAMLTSFGDAAKALAIDDPCDYVRYCVDTWNAAGRAGVVQCEDGTLSYTRNVENIGVSGYPWGKYKPETVADFSSSIETDRRIHQIIYETEKWGREFSACMQKEFPEGYKLTLNAALDAEGWGQSDARDFNASANGPNLTKEDRDLLTPAELKVYDNEPDPHVRLGLLRVFFLAKKAYGILEPGIWRMWQKLFPGVKDVMGVGTPAFKKMQQAQRENDVLRRAELDVIVQLWITIELPKKDPPPPPPPCTTYECCDGEDNDGDDLVDYPNDPGCESPEDEDERNCVLLTGSLSWGIGEFGFVTGVDESVEAIPMPVGDFEWPMRIVCPSFDLQFGLAAQAGGWYAKDTLFASALSVRVRAWPKHTFGIGGEVGFAPFAFAPPDDADNQGGLGLILSSVVTIEGIKSPWWWLPLPPNVEIRPGAIFALPRLGVGGGGYLGLVMYWNSRTVPIRHVNERR